MRQFRRLSRHRTGHRLDGERQRRARRLNCAPGFCLWCIRRCSSVLFFYFICPVCIQVQQVNKDDVPPCVPTDRPTDLIIILMYRMHQRAYRSRLSLTDIKIHDALGKGAQCERAGEEDKGPV